MNYLIREKSLLRAISDRYKEKPREEKDAEFDKITDLLMGLVRGYSNSIEQTISKMFGKSVDDTGDPADPICSIMYDINSMCIEYGVDPMFPEAEGKPDRKEVANALNEYIAQIGAVDRHSRQAFEKAVETKDYEEYDRLRDYLTENIEEILKKDRSEQ